MINKDIVSKLIGDTGMEKRDFSIDWFHSTSPLVILLILGNVFAPHIPIVILMAARVRRRRRIEKHGGVQDILAKRKTDGIYCQEELNRAFGGPEFHLKVCFCVRVHGHTCVSSSEPVHMCIRALDCLRLSFLYSSLVSVRTNYG